MMNLNDAKALIMRLNPKYPFDIVSGISLTRLYLETIQDLLGKGYGYTAVGLPPDMSDADRIAVSKAIESHAFHSDEHEPVDINPAKMSYFEASVIAELLRHPPANLPEQPSGGYTKADLDAAYTRGYKACQADVGRLSPILVGADA